MAGVARAIVSPLSIIDKDLGRLVLQVVAVVAVFIPGGQPVAAAAALALATLYKPKGPKPEQQERSIKTALPPRISAYGTVRLYGAYMLYDTNGDGFAVDAWAFHDGRIDSILFRYLGDKRITLNGAGFVLPQDKEFGDGDTVRIGTRLGLATETAFSELISRLPGIWTNNHRGDGVATGCMISKPVKQKNFNDVYPQGGPDANQLSLVVQAQLVFDWRDPAQSPYDQNTWKFSDNGALCTAHYYMVRAYKDWDTHFAPTLSSWTAAANDCDVAVPLKAGGTEKRYRVALAHKHTDTHKATIGNLLAAWDGFIAPRSDGALVAWSGRYVDPDPADLIGRDEIVSYSWDYGIVDEDQSNEIAVSYLSADHDYTTVDATSWRDEDAIFADGELKTTPLENAVPSHGQARRLAKRLMAKTMAPNRGSVTTTIAGRKIRGKRFIPLHIEEAGAVFFSGTAEIVRLRRNLTTGGVTFDWIKADPNVPHRAVQRQQPGGGPFGKPRRRHSHFHGESRNLRDGQPGYGRWLSAFGKAVRQSGGNGNDRPLHTCWWHPHPCSDLCLQHFHDRASYIQSRFHRARSGRRAYRYLRPWLVDLHARSSCRWIRLVHGFRLAARIRICRGPHDDDSA